MTQEEVRGRIEAFVADFQTRWQRSGKSPGMFAFDPGVFEAWAAELAALVATHCTPGMRTGAEGALASSPAHYPDAEQITDIEVYGHTATVRSVCQTAGNTTYYYKYQLLRGVDGWRISHLSTFLDMPGTPLSVDLSWHTTTQMASRRTESLGPAHARGLSFRFDQPREHCRQLWRAVGEKSDV